MAFRHWYNRSITVLVSTLVTLVTEYIVCLLPHVLGI